MRSHLLLLPLLLLATLATSARAGEAPATITPPRLIGFVNAELPEGTPFRDADVILVLTIGIDGKVTEATIRQGVGSPYDEAAVAAALGFTFDPARQGEAAVAVRVPFTYSYRIPKRRGRMLEAARRARRELVPAPGYQYAGSVLEKGTRKPLLGVPVIVTDPRTKRTWEVTTDEDGVFRIYGLPPGQLDLNIITPGYRTASSRFRGQPLPKDEEVRPPPARTWYLNPKPFMRYRTVVRDKRRPPAASEVVLTEDELTRIPGTFGDPTRVVQTLPGVSRSPFGLGYYVVRGASFDNTGFFIDGHPAVFLYHLAGGPGVIHPELVGDLRFYPGGYPAEFGRFAGGAIAINTKDPPDDRWHLDVEFDVFRAALLFSIPFDDKRGQVTVSFRRSYYELLLPLIEPSVDLEYTDYQLRVRYDITPRVRWKFVALGAEDALSSEGNPANAGDDATSSLGLGFHRLNTAVEAELSPTVKLTNSLAWEYDHTDARRVAEGDDSVGVDFSGWFIQNRLWVDFKPDKTFTFTGGLDAAYLTLGADLTVPSFPPLGDPRDPIFDPLAIALTLDAPLTSIAPYLMADWEVVKGLRLLPGFRLSVDEYEGTTHVTVDPKLAVRWEFLEGWTLKGSAGMAHQPPAVFQTAPPFGDPTLPPLESVQTSLGFEWIPADGWDVSVEGFYNEYLNMPQTSNQVTTEDGKLGRVLWNTDMRGRSFGAELMIRKAMGDMVYGWLSYTLSRSERLRPPADWTVFQVDQTHVLNLAWTVVLPDEWSIGARFSLTSGNPYYRIVGARYDADRDRYEPIYAASYSRLPIYHRLDLRVDKRWRFDTWLFELYLDIQNVYNAGNPEAPRYSFDYKIRSDGVSLPILPTLGMRASF